MKDLNPIKRLRLVSILAGLAIMVMCCALLISVATPLPVQAQGADGTLSALDAQQFELNAEKARRRGEIAQMTADAKQATVRAHATLDQARRNDIATATAEANLTATAVRAEWIISTTETAVVQTTGTAMVQATGTHKAEIAATSTRQREMVIEDLRNKAEQDAVNLRRVRIVGYSLLLVIGAFFTVPFGRWVIVVLWPRIQGGKPTVMYTATILPAPAADERPMSDAEAVDATKQSVRDFQVDIGFDEPRREMEDLADLLRQHGTAPEGMR